MRALSDGLRRTLFWVLTGAVPWLLSGNPVRGELRLLHSGGEQVIEQVTKVGDRLLVVSTGNQAAPPGAAQPTPLGIPARSTAAALVAALPPNVRVFASSDGSRQGVARYTGDDQGRVRTTFVFIGAAGPRWSRETEGLATYLLSDDGSTVVEIERDFHHPDASSVTFLDGGSGAQLSELARPFLRAVQIAADGTTIALSTGRGQIEVVDRRGQRQFSVESTGDFVLDPSGRQLAVLEPGRVDLVAAGMRTHSFSVDGFARDVAFDGSSRLVAIVDGSTLQMHDLQSLTATHRVVGGDGIQIQSLSFIQEGRGIVVGTLEIKEKTAWSTSGAAEARLLVFDRDGILRQEDSLPLRRWNRLTPEIQLLDDGEQPILKTVDEVYEFRVRELPAGEGPQ